MSVKESIIMVEQGLSEIINTSLHNLEEDTGLKVSSVWIDRDLNGHFNLSVSVKVGSYSLEIKEND